MRAYRLTGEAIFLQVARRAIHTFELDILDGGVSSLIGNDGIFFEEVAVYPAAHILNGYIFALFGLYDYIRITDNQTITLLIQKSLSTFHTLIDEFDIGYWSRYDLLFKHLAPQFYHKLHILMLEALSKYSGCEHCSALAARWAEYQKKLTYRLHYLIASFTARYCRGLRRVLFHHKSVAEKPFPKHVCVPITAFPIIGGMSSVLSGVAKVMTDEWQMEYLTKDVGPNSDGLLIHRFGSASTTPWYFPNIWLYALAGWCKLISLLRSGPSYHLILSQDGVFTGAFSALAAKIAGVYVVCMDHGTVTQPYSQVYYAERMKGIMSQQWPRRLFYRLQLVWYWPSLRLLTRIATRYTDHFLAAGEDVAEVYCRNLGVHPSRITLFPFLVDVDCFTPLDAAAKAQLRLQNGLAPDAIIITMINRLSLAKGLDIALQGISQMLLALPFDLHKRIHVIIAGDGPLRSQIKADIRRYEMDSLCTLWGEATQQDVATLLSISDIFLYTATRGINSMAVLEAMAAGCTVIASKEPHSMEKLLAEGRGIAISVGSADAVSIALTQVINDMSCCPQIGQLAREYIAKHHSSMALKRCLQRATYGSVKISNMSLYDNSLLSRQEIINE